MNLEYCNLNDLKDKRPDLYKAIVKEVFLGKLGLTKEDIMDMLQPLSDSIKEYLLPYLDKLPRMTYNDIVDMENDIIDEISGQLLDVFDDMEELANKRYGVDSFENSSIVNFDINHLAETFIANSVERPFNEGASEQRYDNKDNSDDERGDEEGDVKVGYVIRLLPSQDVGRIEQIKILNNGLRKLIVKLNDGSAREVYDNCNLYEVMQRKNTEREVLQEKVEMSEIQSENIDKNGINTTNCNIELSSGDEITYDSTHCKVIAVKKTISSTRLVIQYDDGSLDNVLLDYNKISLSKTSEEDFQRSLSVDNKVNLTEIYAIENRPNRCRIIDNCGEEVFSSKGQLIRLNKIFYVINYLDSLVSMFIIQEESNGIFSLGRRILSAHSHSPLYTSLNKQNYLKQFKAVKFDDDCDEYYILIDDRWYGYSGFYADIIKDENNQATNSDNEESTNNIEEPSLDAMEVEHVFLDSRGHVIEKITSSQLDLSAENRRGKGWTQEEEELITRYFDQGRSIAAIATTIGRTEVAIKARLAKLGLIEYTYGQEEVEPINNEDTKNSDEDDFRIENSFTRCSIFNKDGEKVFSEEGKLKYIGGKLYRLNLKNECFTIKSMRFDGSIWLKGEKKIVAYPQTELYRIMDKAVYYIDDVEDIVDAPLFEKCKLKVKGIWYKYNGDLVSDDKKNVSDAPKRPFDRLRIIRGPLYAVRKQAVLRAMSFFRLPTTIKNITRTISRTAWRDTIKEEDVEDIVKTMSEVESVEGKYILRKD